jgi:hypothetical protein
MKHMRSSDDSSWGKALTQYPLTVLGRLILVVILTLSVTVIYVIITIVKLPFGKYPYLGFWREYANIFTNCDGHHRPRLWAYKRCLGYEIRYRDRHRRPRVFWLSPWHALVFAFSLGLAAFGYYGLWDLSGFHR